MKKYSEKVREEAAVIASIGACDAHRSHALADAMIEADQNAINLYWAAWHFLNSGAYKSYPAISPEHDAEAECLIRCGWSPGDEP